MLHQGIGHSCIQSMAKSLKFKFSKDARTTFYTTNAIESLNSTLRRLNRQRSVFPSSQALLEELKNEKNSFKKIGIDYEEKAFYDILKSVAKKYEFEYPDYKMVEFSKRIKLIVDDKSKYTDWASREDIKANLQVDLILLLDEFGYSPVTLDDVYKEVLEQAENFKKYS